VRIHAGRRTTSTGVGILLLLASAQAAGGATAPVELLSEGFGPVVDVPPSRWWSVPPVRWPGENQPAVPACTFASRPAANAAYDDWALTLLDPAHALPASYQPPDLVPVGRTGLPGGGRVRSFVIPDLRALADAARAAGAPLSVRSAYRSYAYQAQVFAGWVAMSGRADALRFSARPGHSEHQLGTAVDLAAAGGPAPWNGHFARTHQGRWLARHAWRFGFVVSYPPSGAPTTCYAAEAWHLRYLGRAEAREIHRSGLTPREWLWRHARDR
jgi:D-alanyl-D-alanine carboxypeptidase